MISESSQHVLFRRPRMLTFITTYKCGAVCDHCLMSCTPNNSDRLTLPQMRQFIDSFAEVCVGSGVVVFTGGECTLLGDDLLEAIAYANSLGLFTRIVTNAWWAKSERDAETFLNELKSCGLDEINISCDDFHAEYIPLENVRNLWNSAKTMGFQTLGIAVCRDNNSTISPAYLCKYLNEDIPLLHQFDDNTQPPRAPARFITNSGITRIGRARNLSLNQNARPQARLLASHCSDCGQDFVISPNCHLAPCCGINAEGTWLFDLGKINLTDDINELQLLLLNYIQYIGPGGLLKHLRTSGGLSSFGRSNYLSQCEICEDIALSKEAQTCLAKLAPKLAADLIVETKFETTFIGNGSDIHD